MDDNKPIRVILADDHTLVRGGIRALLKSIPGIEVVAEASTGSEAVQLAREHAPDVVVMDIAMKDMNGLNATAQIKQDRPNTCVIILSMYSGEEYVERALQQGASGYLVKESATEELALALQAVHRGDTYLSPAVSKPLVDRYLGRDGTGPDGGARLTPRQREILQLIAKGRSSKEIARELDLSVRTVETHRTQLMERLDIKDVPGLVRYAIRIGLVSPED